MYFYCDELVLNKWLQYCSHGTVSRVAYSSRCCGFVNWLKKTVCATQLPVNLTTAESSWAVIQIYSHTCSTSLKLHTTEPPLVMHSVWRKQIVLLYTHILRTAWLLPYWLSIQHKTIKYVSLRTHQNNYYNYYYCFNTNCLTSFLQMLLPVCSQQRAAIQVKPTAAVCNGH